MKKTLLLFLLTCFIFSTSIAQGGGIEIRPHIGINSSTLTDEPEGVRFKDQIGYQFGVDLQIGSRVYLQPGISFEAVKNEIEDEAGNIKTDLTVNRIRVPILIGIRLIESNGSSNFNLRLFTGPNISFVLDKKLDADFRLEEDDFKGSVYGWNVGGGLDFSVLFVDAGYTFGLSEIFDSFDATTKNNLFYLNAGLRVRL